MAILFSLRSLITPLKDARRQYTEFLIAIAIWLRRKSQLRLT
jgi:hypothetical protein